MEKKLKQSKCEYIAGICSFRSMPICKFLICQNYQTSEDLSKVWDIPYEYYSIDGISILKVKDLSDGEIELGENLSNLSDIRYPYSQDSFTTFGNWSRLSRITAYSEIKKHWLNHGWMAAEKIPIVENISTNKSLNEIPF